MMEIFPFEPVLPSGDLAKDIVARPFEDYSREEVSHKLTHNPYSYLHIIRSVFDKENPNSISAGDGYEKFISNNWLRKLENGMLIYEQQKGEEIFSGVICLIDIENYKQGKIKKHENILDERVNLMSDHFENSGFNADPICLFHEDNQELGSFLKTVKDRGADLSFKTSDGFSHRLWLVEKGQFEQLQSIYSEISEMYIADGHHRVASTERLYDRYGENYRYFMGALFAESQLKVYPYHRIIQPDTQLNFSDIEEELKEEFDIEDVSESLENIRRKGEFLLVLPDAIKKLNFKNGLNSDSNLTAQLDSHILATRFIDRLITSKQENKSPKIKFINGEKGVQELVREVDGESGQIGVALHPASLEEVRSIADANEIMPAKTTWICPKLRSAMIIHAF